MSKVFWDKKEFKCKVGYMSKSWGHLCPLSQVEIIEIDSNSLSFIHIESQYLRILYLSKLSF